MYPDKVMVEGVFYRDPRFRKVAGTDPAAGVEVSETVPTSRAWLVASVRVDFVADGTVVSRVPGLILDDGTNEFARSTMWEAVAASQTARLTWALNLAHADGTPSTTTNGQHAGLPFIILPAAGRVRTSTDSIQVGDNYGAPIFYVVEYRSAS